MSLDELVIRQQLNGKSLLTAINNYKKSPFERKTLIFIEKRWQQIYKLWSDFKSLDKRIQKYRLAMPNHYYFQQELYELVRDKYMALRVRINKEKKDVLKHEERQPAQSC